MTVIFIFIIYLLIPIEKRSYSTLIVHNIIIHLLKEGNGQSQDVQIRFVSYYEWTNRSIQAEPAIHFSTA